MVVLSTWMSGCPINKLLEFVLKVYVVVKCLVDTERLHVLLLQSSNKFPITLDRWPGNLGEQTKVNLGQNGVKWKTSHEQL